MMRTPHAARALAAATLTLAGASLLGAADAAACDRWRADHNGSTMRVVKCGGALTISYARPRPGMRRQGVVSGEMLFDGSVSRGRVRGQAAVFKRGCGPAWYFVSGRMSPSGRITLSGRAPVRGAGCRTTRSRDDYLVFD